MRGEKRITYASLDTGAARVAAGLAAEGVAPGEEETAAILYTSTRHSTIDT